MKVLFTFFTLFSAASYVVYARNLVRRVILPMYPVRVLTRRNRNYSFLNHDRVFSRCDAFLTVVVADREVGLVSTLYDVHVRCFIAQCLSFHQVAFAPTCATRSDQVLNLVPSLSVVVVGKTEDARKSNDRVPRKI